MPPGHARARLQVATAALEHLAAAAELLGVDAEGLGKALTTRTRQTPDGPIVRWAGAGAARGARSGALSCALTLLASLASPIDVKAADDNRDSLSKTIYSRMFDWLVEKINTSIGQDPSAASLIGVLDIYGARAAARATHAHYQAQAPAWRRSAAQLG